MRTWFVVSNYLLSGLALASLALSEILPLPVNLLATAILALLFYLESIKILPVLPPGKISLLNWALLGIPVFYLSFNLPILEAITAFLILLMFSRLAFKTELNDYLYGYLVSIVCLLIGAVYIQSLTFGGLFIAFYLTLSWCLIFYNMTAERVGSLSPPSRFKSAGENESPGASLFALSTAMVAASLILTAVIFVAFPRMGLGFLSLNSKANPISGFSNSVTLGDVGKILQNQEVVMRVQFKKNDKEYRPPVPIYWRGVALDHYNGKTWTATVDSKLRLRNRPGVGLNLFMVDPPVDVVDQEIFMETFDSDFVFTNGIPIYLDGNFSRLDVDQSFSLRLPDNHYGPRKLLLTSETGHPKISYDIVGPGGEPPEFLERFLQVPELSSQIISLADELTYNAKSPLAKTVNILEFLADGFGYSLEMVHDTNATGLDEFLFVQKKGHCEYFASAMTILLRLGGTPARIVNGFMGTEWNEMGDYMIVRQAHAHSWVEAFIPGQGWTLFDPTPPDPQAGSLDAQSAAARMMDLLRLNWQRYIVRYSLKDQINIVSWFGESGRDMAFGFKNLQTLKWKTVFESIQKNMLPLLLAVVGITAALFFLRRDFGFSLRPQPPFAVQSYRLLLRKLEKQGVPKPPNWTHRELLRRLDPLPEEKRSAARKVIEFYESSRFAHRVPDDEQKKDVKDLLEKL